jgi:hypothetical protein
MSAGLYWYALRVARRRQLLRRASRPLRRRAFPRRVPGASVRPLQENEALWRSAAFERPASEPSGRLAGFAANYGDDVLAAARAGAPADAAALLERWLASYPPRRGDAWHPYVVSTRIGNWLAALTLAPELATASLAESLRLQASYLARNVEDDILGNHVVRNAKALVLAGAALGDERLLGRGRAVLERELPEQVLADGGHYERSPAYHRLVLRDLLEVAAWADVGEAAAAMRGFAAASSRPDGAPWLFNDGGLDIAPSLDLDPPLQGIDVREASGYVFVRGPRLALAFDCGPPSPAFLPAHAHADALSFQLWLDGRAVVVDPGTSTYEPGPARDRERGTEAHATVAVDGDQFRLWGAFRSGPLPAVRLLAADAQALAGEALLPSGHRIRRTIHLGDAHLEVEDEVTGPGEPAVTSSLPLAPGVEVTVSSSAPFAWEQRTFAERFGSTSENRAAVVRSRGALPWRGTWRIG